MRRIGRVLALAIVVTASMFQLSHAVNSVTVESKSFFINSPACTVGVWFVNDVQLSSFVLPLEVRSLTNGAFMLPPFTNTNLKWQERPGGRISQSGLGQFDDLENGEWSAANLTRQRYATPGGTCAPPQNSTYQVPTPQPDGVSPDAFLYADVSVSDPAFQPKAFLAPGSDVTPSIELIFPANGNAGTFEIDTCCTTPANHITFVDQDVFEHKPDFVKGTITLVVNAVKELETSIIPQDYALEQNYPNPFNAGTIIRFDQPVDGNVKIDVYNILGAKVRTLVDEFRVAGTHQTDWDGRNDDGQMAATGVYFYRITSPGFTSTRKMVMIK